ncbi:MAG TPA: NAD(P)-binding protein [Sphingomonas sp.]|uniref:NAD(P)/FAD-dependent oxidoreductase n=1 Tax=Sphingomonas sp. TaxID=28214 RepID=UPI002EDA5D72
MRVAIIGAGMAGLACAERLRAGGHAVVAYDKGRGPGGRMATRRMATAAGEIAFDHGAQYFTARDPDFIARVAQWHAAGVVARWPAAGDDAWVGNPAMNAPLRAVADACDVRWGMRIDALVPDGGGWGVRGEGVADDGYDAVVIAVPAEQVAALVAAQVPAFARQAEGVRSAPCWTLMAAFSAPVAVATDVIRRAGMLDWAARNSAKPGRSGPEAWVAHAMPDWSRDHLEAEPAAVATALLAGLAEAVGQDLPATIAVTAHRWRYARSGALGCDALWDGHAGIGLCGDWLLAPRVESAWLSGWRLAEVMPGA